MTALTDDLRADVETIGRIDAVSRILDVVCRTTGMGFAAVARVTEDRWIACQVLDKIAFGLEPGGELVVSTTICHEIRQTGDPVIIDHVAEDAAYCGHPTPAMYGFQSYISMPIVRKDGSFFGTLCAIDPKPARLNTPEIVSMFRLFAELIAFHIDAVDLLATSEARLQEERELSHLREQFIAVIGHDLRNPLASINAGAKFLLREPVSEKAGTILTLMQGSVHRMATLIDNVLDFARGRLGGGMSLGREPAALAPILQQVVDEFRGIHPERQIDVRYDLDEPVSCDRARIGQLFSNLLGNAMAYGSPGAAVQVDAFSRDGRFELTVSNAGEPIAAGSLERLFQPFYRGDGKSNQKGLGLGLYIAAEIARAHGGTLEVDSSPERTRFTFTMPSG